MRWNVEATSLQTWWERLLPPWRQALAANLDLSAAPDHHDLQCLIDTAELDLSGSQLADLTPLLAFPHLERLDLSHACVRDLTGLAQLTQLRELHLTCSPCVDLAPITCLTQLEVLDLSYPQRALRGPLSLLDGFTSLRELYCNACHLRDVVPFVGMQQLELLSLNFNHIPREEIAALRELLPACRILA